MAAPLLQLVAGPPRAALLVAPGGTSSAAGRRAQRTLLDGGFSLLQNGAEPADGVSHVAVLVHDGPAEARIASLRALQPRAGCAAVAVVLPDDCSARILRRALQEGADAIVLDSRIEDSLLDAVRAAAAGQLCVPLGMRPVLAPLCLSHREREVLALVAMGLTNVQIAGRLYLAESTVKTHLSSVFAKMGVASRAEAAAKVRDPDIAGPLGLAGLS
jgi:DNA-binding NarL/FixJ family response regulator